MINLLKLIAKLFGKNAINKTIGTRTNVIQLPNNEIKRYIKQDLNIEAASDAAAMNAKKEMEQLIPEIPKMNDAERLIFEGNLRRLDNRINPPMAEVVEFGTKEKVTPEGITSLIKEKGQKAPPGTVMGNLESRVKQLEASGKDLSKMKGQTLDEIMGDVMQTQKTMSKMQDEGLVRAAVRYKMMDDLKRGTLKLPKNLEDVVRGASNEEDVITVFRNNYGEDALEQVDSLIPDFYNMTSPADAVKKIEKDFPNMKPKKIEVKQTTDLDEAKKAEQENILTPKKPDEPEEFATGGRVGYSDGTKPSAEENTPSQEIINRMIAQIKQMSKMGADVATIKEITGASDQMMKDVLGKASGGSMSKGLDYLMGIERQGYANGDYVVQAGIKNYLGKQKTATVPIKWKSGKDHPDTELAYITKPEKELLIKLDLHGSMKDGKPNKGPGGIISLNSGGSGNGGSGGGGGGGGSDASGNDTSPGATGGAGGDPGDPGSEASGGGGSTDTGDMGSEAANVSSTQSGAASVGVGGIGGFGDPGVAVGTGFMGSLGNFGRNVANMARANPISSMVATAVLGPIGSLALNAARAYGPTGTTSTTSTTESDGDGTSNALIQQAIADPLGLNAAARDMSGVDALYNQYRTNVGFQSGGRVGFKDGSKLPKEKTTLPINPMMDEGVDLNKRGFLKGAAGVGAGIAALGTGALRLARKGAKKIKDIDIDVGVAMDGDYDDYLERAVASYNTIFNIKANTKAGKKLLDKLAKEKKIVKEKDGTYSADTMGDINSPTIDALQDIKNKSSYNLSFEGNTFKNTDEASEYLRNKYSPLRDDRYNESFLSEDMEEVVDILAPKSAKEVIKERADLIEKTLKQRGDFASGGLSYLQGI
jgi:hypothetical protein